MEGYSVTEAASVLGVPTERVWELLARGVLSGSPEGETGMRVFLQPRPAPAPAEARPANGGSEPARELSPFRELLTEFRNLTERYGQALLALGEARGEVAALRSRVDLLEARMDLRLPMGAGAAAGWGSPSVPMPAEQAMASPFSPAGPHDQPVAAPSRSRHRRGETHAPPDAEPEAATDDDGHRSADEEEHRGRRRGPRRATESFAEALARAEDPSAPELPARPDAAAAAHADGPTDAPDLPREGPAAEAVLVAEEGDVAIPPIGAASEPAAVVGPTTEPEIAPDAEQAPVEATAAVEAETSEAATSEAAAGTEPEVGAGLEGPDAADEPPDTLGEAVTPPTSEGTEPAPLDVAGDEPIEADAQVAEVERDASLGATEAAAAELDEPVAPSEPSATMTAEGEPIVWDSERYTTTIEEPDWFAAEVYEPPVAIEPAGEAPEEPADEPGPEPVDVAADTESAPPPDRSDTPPSDSVGWAETREETVLWFGREPANEAGAAEMEVAATSTTPESGPVPGRLPRELPGADELHDALAALEAPGRGAIDAAAPPRTGGETATPEPEDDATREPEPDEWPPRTPSATRDPSSTSAWSVPAATAPPGGPRAGSTGPATSGPASRAYRRLRRIFPG